ncbi:P-II family nitrogen regulator, partial [Anaerotignum lactatifermentans]|uniref:P-II family nitrogen regulator n=1 Tax=Anaerotignum lactatifermentans TaxID=160404 RepID=UPI001A9B4492
ALFEAHVRGMTIVQVQGCGNSHGWTEYVRGRQVPLNTIPKVQFDLVVDDSQVDDIVAVICAAARTGEVGDGKIFVAPVEEVVEAMAEAASEVRDGEVTTAVRDSQAADGSPIRSGDVMGIVSGSIDVVGSDVKDVTLECVRRMQAEEEGDTLTILAGSDLSDEAFEEIVAAIEEDQPDLEIDPHRGEQPLYPVIFSIE